jgi:hypothetical protein
MIGELLSPTLKEIEETLWEFEANSSNPPEYTQDGFKAACKIFMSAMMDKMWEEQERLEIPMGLREKEAEMLGYKIRALALEHTGIDTHELYK